MSARGGYDGYQSPCVITYASHPPEVGEPEKVGNLELARECQRKCVVSSM